MSARRDGRPGPRETTAPGRSSLVRRSRHASSPISSSSIWTISQHSSRIEQSIAHHREKAVRGHVGAVTEEPGLRGVDAVRFAQGQLDRISAKPADDLDRRGCFGGCPQGGLAEGVAQHRQKPAHAGEGHAASFVRDVLAAAPVTAWTSRARRSTLGMVQSGRTFCCVSISTPLLNFITSCLA